MSRWRNLRHGLRLAVGSDEKTILTDFVVEQLRKEGYQLFHNYIRPHEGLDGATPAERAGIRVEGGDKWTTLIQNASRAQVRPG